MTCAKLTDAVVLHLRSQGKIKDWEKTAEHYGVSVKTLHKAFRGKTWKHLAAAAPNDRQRSLPPGVYSLKNRFRVSVQCHGVSVSFGTYDTVEEATQVADRARADRDAGKLKDGVVARQRHARSACVEIVAAFGRAATEAGLRPGVSDGSSPNSPPGGVDALPGGLFGEGEGARVACSVITDRNNTTQGSNNVGDFVQDFGAARA